MRIEEFDESHWSQVWPIIREVVQARDTFAYDPHLTEDEARALWVARPPGRTVVAVADDRVLGTATMGPNRPGPGSHISTASFMVAADARGRGTGTALCAHALGWARAHGFAGMQFNAVVETNLAAVAVYQRLGFRVIGTVPGAFAHPHQGHVGLHVMYCAF